MLRARRAIGVLICPSAIWWFGVSQYRRCGRQIDAAASLHGNYAVVDAIRRLVVGQFDYAMLVKMYGETGQGTPERKYSPAECCGISKRTVEGKPDPKHVSTSYAERNNGIIRQHCKRYARLTLAFSKKLQNHEYAFALHAMYHNFVKISGAHRMTPAQAAGVDSRLWEISDMVKMIAGWESAQ